MISTSSSNWLDRLRSSRGFPTGDEPDLERFISLSSSSGSVESATHVTREKGHQWTPPPGELGTVLSDLFNMGGDVSNQQDAVRKKACRKQPNPRFFSVETEFPTSSDDLILRSQNAGLLSSDDHSNNNNNNINNDNSNNNNDKNNVNVGEVRAAVDGKNVANENEDDSDDLKEYSRSEVTIIDTSFQEWKSDKWVFRKNDEWKIKEKKSRFKSKVSGGGNTSTNKKKRKLLVSNLGDNTNSNNNKLEDDQLMMNKKKEKKEDELPNKRQPRNDKGRDSFQKRQAYLGKVPQKRFPCPRPPEKLKNEGSPVILIKSIPLNDNTDAMKTGKTSQKIRPKKMKVI